MRKSLKNIYDKMHRHFGPRCWWPAKSRFEVMVGAVLTQNTSWSNVEKAISNLKKEKCLSLSRIKNIPTGKLSKLIRPSGFHRQKAKKLKDFVNFLFELSNGKINKLLNIDIDILRVQLLSVNGIGPETADSILLYALDKPIFVVDTYTKRIFGRHNLIDNDASYGEVQNFFMNNLNPDLKLFNEYHALIVETGKTYCKKKKPLCSECPLGVRKTGQK